MRSRAYAPPEVKNGPQRYQTAFQYQLRNQTLHFKPWGEVHVGFKKEDQEDDLRGTIDEAVGHLDVTLPWIVCFTCSAKSDAPKRRISSCNLFAVFCEESDLDSSFYCIDWVRQLVSLFDDQQVPVHTAAWQAFDVSFKSVPMVELESLVGPPAPDDGEN
ncbi:hypothetical protein CY34DRAFT_784107 [Suillus luteus UH-Slu-Lm8-n1]|uniref:Stalled ribosome sensor GCN1-like HEAT repeats region domain-containing protein n=1 Tax=Suillus luteus UH-Slu-Lm8-n1 TaxID=930992 RepID=A0A0C9ZW05_9AGAM|nr:hypothetical protein CY34DRAFT_790236 [Suillus luteus UH-Slu-Lm8-n1]KIK35038.1 hypothetical protein CY34DRAFT_784107 [Suillus luteus UH-Slu-Lm8-n1]